MVCGIRRNIFSAFRRDNPPYVVVEKILSGDERFPADWPADGTTGYDFLNRVNGLFVMTANASAFDKLYREFTGNDLDFAAIVYQSRIASAGAFVSRVNSIR